MQIYVQRNGQQNGPYAEEQIRQELNAGTLHGADLAWYEGAPNWLPLASVPGLNAAAPYPPTFYPGAPSGYPPHPAAPQTSGLAVASMVMGLLGLLVVLTALPAVICGHLALSQINKSMGRLGGRGMAVTGLATGYGSMLLTVVVIFGIALPVFNTVQEKGQAVKSMGMAKQIGLGCKIYATDNEGKFPRTLEELIPTYLSDAHLFICPLDKTRSAMGYDYFGNGLTDSDDPRTVLLQSKTMTSDGKRVVVYVDCSTEMVRR